MNNAVVKFVLTALMLLCGVISIFFVFYTARLLYVTHGLTVIRPGGEGTYIGAAVFPILALVFGYISRRLYKRIRTKSAA